MSYHNKPLFNMIELKVDTNPLHCELSFPFLENRSKVMKQLESDLTNFAHIKVCIHRCSRHRAVLASFGQFWPVILWTVCFRLEGALNMLVDLLHILKG